MIRTWRSRFANFVVFKDLDYGRITLSTQGYSRFFTPPFFLSFFLHSACLYFCFLRQVRSSRNFAGELFLEENFIMERKT